MVRGKGEKCPIGQQRICLKMKNHSSPDPGDPRSRPAPAKNRPLQNERTGTDSPFPKSMRPTPRPRLRTELRKPSKARFDLLRKYFNGFRTTSTWREDFYGLFRNSQKEVTERRGEFLRGSQPQQLIEEKNEIPRKGGYA